MSDLGSSFTILVVLLLHLRSLKIFLYKKKFGLPSFDQHIPKRRATIVACFRVSVISSNDMESSHRRLFISDSLKLNLILFKGVTLSMHFLLRWSAANGDTRESICDYLVVDKKQSCRHQTYFMTNRPENIQASTFFKYFCRI